MIIRIKRNLDPLHVIGKLTIDEEPFEAVTLEHPTRPVKIDGKTGIPLGEYELKPRRAGEIYEKYCKKFKCDHPIIWLQNVPGFQYVYIHIGNYIKDSLGCILIGRNWQFNGSERMILDSTATYLLFHKLVSAAWDRQETVTLKITRLP